MAYSLEHHMYNWNIICLPFPDKEEQVIAVDGRVCLEQKIFENLNYLGPGGLNLVERKKDGPSENMK